MIQRSIKKVTVEYVNGETETFEVDGFIKKMMNNEPRELRLDKKWTEYEIRWSDREKPAIQRSL